MINSRPDVKSSPSPRLSACATALICDFCFFFCSSSSTTSTPARNRTNKDPVERHPCHLVPYRSSSGRSCQEIEHPSPSSHYPAAAFTYTAQPSRPLKIYVAKKNKENVVFETGSTTKKTRCLRDRSLSPLDHSDRPHHTLFFQTPDSAAEPFY
ncbi:hypothetical protein VTJ04DRAFT_2674 [Mycothermus thermophilus]|uniref:uncharacterized protein n=1 Tax=Humicola insolens TaxID=85995 RepID=UPI003741FF9A